jgi:hypothetical protein
MTKAEWLACGEPEVMLSFLRNRVSDRKLRLFAVACCRRIWPLLIDDRSRQAIVLAERFAERCASRAERVAARTAALAAVQTSWRNAPPNDPDAWRAWRSKASCQATAASAAQWSAARSAYEAACNCARKAWYVRAAVAVAEKVMPVASSELWARTEREEKARQVAIICDVVGDPFRSVGIGPEPPNWRTEDVKELARRIDAEQSYDRLPSLAETLRGAGCGEEDLIEHCRQGTDHVRGCWAIDLLLGKE